MISSRTGFGIGDTIFRFVDTYHNTNTTPSLRAVPRTLVLHPSRQTTNIVIQSTTAVMLINICLWLSTYATAVRIVFVIMIALSPCSSFTPRCPQPQLIMLHIQPTNSILPRRTISPVHLFRDLVGDDEEDLRADIVVIREQLGMEAFLKVDDRLCVIK